MKKLILLTIVLLNFSLLLKAQSKTIKMGTTKIEIAGNQVSDIKLVNYAGKELGNLYTHTSITDTEIIFSQYQNYKDGGIDFVCIQRITISSVADLIVEVEVSKAFIDPERRTNPKQYWGVSIAFKQKNKEYMDVGATTNYRLSYETGKPKTVKENYTGTQRLLPFATKKAAEEFAAKVKEAIATK
jgi:hypothetical protein